MKKILPSFFSIVCFFFLLLVTNAGIEINSEHAILLNLDENRILYEKKSHELVPMASLTKIMTAIVAIEHIDNLEETVIIKSEDLKGLKEANASVAGFRVGQKVNYYDLLYGLLLPSGADAANALTRLVAGSTEKFVSYMNQLANELNLSKTHFENATGLDSENHYSTAEEMSIIFKYALQNSEFKKIIETPQYTISDHTFSVMSTVTKNIKRNQLALDYISGGKTGTTDNAGLCLATIASFNGTNYMLVTIKAPQDGKTPTSFYDAETIYDYFMENYENQMVIESDEKILSLNAEYTKEKNINFYSDRTIIKYLPKNFQKENLEYRYEEENLLSAKTKTGTHLGTLQVFYEEELLSSFPILLTTELHFDFMSFLLDHKIIIIGCMLVLIILIVLLYKNIKHKKKDNH